jgi:type IV pilus assembly protein PilM
MGDPGGAIGVIDNEIEQERGGHTLSLGVDLGSHTSKLALLRQSGGRLELCGAAAIDILPGTIRDGIVQNPKLLGRTLSSELERQGAPGNLKAVTSIPSSLASLRWVQLPPLPIDELREAARFKVKRHLPYPVDTAYVEASIPVPEPGETTGESLVIAVPRAVVESRAEALVAAGLNPVGAELEAQALLRVVERRMSRQDVLWRDASLTLIDVGGLTTHMYVVQNQKLQFIRGVRFGANMIASAVAEALDLSIAEAERKLYAFDSRLAENGTLVCDLDGNPTLVNVEVQMEKLVREFTRLLRYFRSLHPERSYAGILDHAIVCGGLVGLPGFTEYLQQSLGLRVERARPLAGMVAQLRRETFQSVSERQEAYAVVVGLALAGLGGPMRRTGELNAANEFAWSRSA